MLDRRSTLLAAAGFAAVLVVPGVVVAAEYMSIDAAQRAAFPSADRFDEMALALTVAQREAVAAAAGPQPPHRSLRAWAATLKGELLGHVFVDEVVGREDFITYSVSIDLAGKLGPLEVLAYRESHGGEIRGSAWRNQFRGRDGLSALRFGADIKNIAGATLSCEHVTQGARWIVALWQVLLRPPAGSTS